MDGTWKESGSGPTSQPTARPVRGWTNVPLAASPYRLDREPRALDSTQKGRTSWQQGCPFDEAHLPGDPAMPGRVMLSDRSTGPNHLAMPRL
jgi:hypothetical protein